MKKNIGLVFILLPIVLVIGSLISVAISTSYMSGMAQGMLAIIGISISLVLGTYLYVEG